MNDKVKLADIDLKVLAYAVSLRFRVLSDQQEQIQAALDSIRNTSAVWLKGSILFDAELCSEFEEMVYNKLHQIHGHTESVWEFLNWQLKQRPLEANEPWQLVIKKHDGQALINEFKELLIQKKRSIGALAQIGVQLHTLPSYYSAQLVAPEKSWKQLQQSLQYLRWHSNNSYYPEIISSLQRELPWPA